MQFRSKNPTHFTNLSSFNIVKNILLQHSQKRYSLYKFSANYVSGWRQRKHLFCTCPRRPKTAFPKHLESKYLCIHVYLYKNYLFQRPRKLLSSGAKQFA